MLTKLSWCLLGRSQQRTVEIPQGNELHSWLPPPPHALLFVACQGKVFSHFHRWGEISSQVDLMDSLSLGRILLYCTIPLVGHVRLNFSSPHSWHVLQQGPYYYFRLSLCVRQICARKVYFVSGSVIVK